MANHAPWIEKCTVPGCPQPAGRDGLCINHRLMARMGDATVKDKVEGRRSKAQGETAAATAAQLPEDERCLAGCNRPRYIRGICTACYTFWRAKPRSPRGLRIAEVMLAPIPAGERGRRRTVPPDASENATDTRLDATVAKFLRELGLVVIDLKGPSRVVINYDARRAVFLEADP